MDPSANLREQIALAVAIKRRAERGQPLDADDVERLADLVVALNTWLCGGGHLPAPWHDAR